MGIQHRQYHHKHVVLIYSSASLITKITQIINYITPDNCISRDMWHPYRDWYAEKKRVAGTYVSQTVVQWDNKLITQVAYQRVQDFDPRLFYCWVSVVNGGLALRQHCVNVSCWFGYPRRQTCQRERERENDQIYHFGISKTYQCDGESEYEGQREKF